MSAPELLELVSPAPEGDVDGAPAKVGPSTKEAKQTER
jgi:hypothetical protein